MAIGGPRAAPFLALRLARRVVVGARGCTRGAGGRRARTSSRSCCRCSRPRTRSPARCRPRAPGRRRARRSARAGRRAPATPSGSSPRVAAVFGMRRRAVRSSAFDSAAARDHLGARAVTHRDDPSGRRPRQRGVPVPGVRQLLWRSCSSASRESRRSRREHRSTISTRSVRLGSRRRSACCCAAFNESVALPHAVRSLLDLDYTEFEVIVVNDGSTDDTLDRLRTMIGLVPVEATSRGSDRDRAGRRATIAHRRIRAFSWSTRRTEGRRTRSTRASTTAATGTCAASTRTWSSRATPSRGRCASSHRIPGPSSG